jgi:SSS family solute:Na+ symporter
MGLLDILVFVAFVVAVIAIGLWKSKGERTHSEHGAQDYFLAGRGLTWWLIGFSLIAANISTEQFVGMSGKAADWLGMAIASYEWMAAITLVIVAFLFLPTFLRSGIYTIPEFLEYRYTTSARTFMAVCLMVTLVGVPTASVIYSGAKVITGNFQGLEPFGYDLGDITVGCWIIGVLSAVYVFAGGLKACAWADLLQGSALIVGGLVIAAFAMDRLSDKAPQELVQTARNREVTVESLRNAGPVQRFWALNKGPLPDGKTHMIRPRDDKEVPWTSLLIGLWIPNFFYWGLNQYITQRTLGSKSLAEGQRGIVFAAFLKLIIPFIVVIPGILAYNLFHGQLQLDAVNRNARVLSKYSPELYRSLSDAMKPDRSQSRNRNILTEIERNLSSGKLPAKSFVYKFDATFASLHPQDAAGIVAYDMRQVAGKLDTPVSRKTPQDMAEFSQKLASAVSEDFADSVAVETLVAHDYDNAFPTLIRELVPVGNGIKGFVLAAIFGAVVSSIAAMLNSASTIAAIDLYHKLRKNASQYELVTVGRVCVVLFVLIAMLIAPSLGHPAFGGIFTYIQDFWGFITSGILAVFLFGVLVHRAPRSCGIVGLLLNPVLYLALKFAAPQMAFLNRQAICFAAIIGVLTAMTIIKPLPKPVALPVNPQMNMTTSSGAKVFGGFVILLTLALYVIFW